MLYVCTVCMYVCMYVCETSCMYVMYVLICMYVCMYVIYWININIPVIIDELISHKPLRRSKSQWMKKRYLYTEQCVPGSKNIKTQNNNNNNNNNININNNTNNVLYQPPVCTNNHQDRPYTSSNNITNRNITITTTTVYDVNWTGLNYIEFNVMVIKIQLL